MKTLIKLTLLIATVFMILSCNSATSEKKNNSKNAVENLDWLLGKWERLHEETGKKTFENWEKIWDKPSRFPKP